MLVITGWFKCLSSKQGIPSTNLDGAFLLPPTNGGPDQLTTAGTGWFYGVMVSTQDSESCDPSSNLGRTLLDFDFVKQEQTFPTEQPSYQTRDPVATPCPTHFYVYNCLNVG